MFWGINFVARNRRRGLDRKWENDDEEEEDEDENDAVTDERWLGKRS